jgi:heme/copper-type cytochrome/quinol oxidase subunit 2
MAIGCHGLAIMAIGAFFLMLIIAWLEFIFVNIISIGITFVVVGFIIYFIYSALTKKQKDKID